jgi:hypothetical protein
MLTIEAFLTSQESMAASPGPMEEGLTVKLTTTGAWPAAPPPMDNVIQPDASSKSITAIRMTFLIYTSSGNQLRMQPSYSDNPIV